MPFAGAKILDKGLIPVIDIKPLIDNTDPVAVASNLHKASQKIGFLYVKGHGISKSVIDNARNSAMNFFHLSDSKKNQVNLHGVHRGWIGANRAIMDKSMKPDLKESFIWGAEISKEESLNNHYAYGNNKWPTSLPNFKNHSLDFFQQTNSVARQLLRGFAISLGLKDNFFTSDQVQALTRASYVYYPPQSERMGEDQFGVGPHTDFGVLTVLSQDHIGGLQVLDLNGNWVHAPPIEDTLVVNVGDLLSRWTDGIFRSTPHRVVNRSGKERLSLVLAYDPSPNMMIDPHDIFGDQCATEHKPITCGDYLTWRFEKSFS